ncbi:glycosyltransferase family 2 protein [Polynucleobacter paneuropaeus]|nr:glycosyltransferase family 2 protein [Polynucleobacter paneuropaeus]
MKISIVTTLYQSKSYINQFHLRASAVARQLVGDDYEIIFVNDGSPDAGLDLAIKLTEHDLHTVVVDLSRNFGHHKAMMTGLAHARGDLIFLTDSDLEEEPEWLLLFTQLMRSEACDVIYGVQDHRKGGWFERWSGQWFYYIFKSITGLPLPENAVTSRLMTRRYVNALLSHKEREMFMAGLWHITGFDQRPHIIKKSDTSATTYTFTRKMSMLVNAVTSFSNAPLVYIFYVGTSISLFAMAYITYLVIHWIFLAKPIGGWTSLMASIWLLGGLIISFIGVVGIYMAKIFSETKRRPYTIIKQVYAKQQD